MRAQRHQESVARLRTVNWRAGKASTFPPIAHIIVEVQQVRKGSDIVSIARVGFDRFGHPLMTAGSAWPMLLEPRGPRENLKRRPLRLRAYPGKDVRIGLPGFDFGEHEFVVDAGELEKL